jgi:ribosomal protein S18 acetylase RimI-like enzyme
MSNTTSADRPEGALSIRNATAADAVALSEFAAHVFHETFAPDNDPLDMHAYLSDAFSPEKQAAEIADGSCVCLIAEVGEALAGYALLRIEAPDESAPDDPSTALPVELQRFYVDRAWHGRGIATQLMAACIDTARVRGGATIWLGVWERNARAIRFYEKHGFTDIGMQEFRLGSDLQTDRVMSRSVREADGASA